MRFDLISIFPDFFRGPLDHGVVPRAREAGKLTIDVHNLRDWAEGVHRITDDRPFGGGEGMVMKPEPIYRCLESLLGTPPAPRPTPPTSTRVVLLSAQGRLFTQADARRFASLGDLAPSANSVDARLILICGRYEGVDERIAAHCVDEELSIGDFVLSGGELAALVVLDAVARLLPGVLGHEMSSINESFSAAAPRRLDCPQYTRPLEFMGWSVPEVLRQGNHAAIARWRDDQAQAKTRQNRPDLLD